MQRISLSEAIQDLRSEVLIAMRAAEEQAEVVFQLGSIELELEVEAERSATGKGGLKWWLVEATAEAKSAVTKSQKIKLSLEPLVKGSSSNTGARVLVSDEGSDKPR